MKKKVGMGVIVLILLSAALYGGYSYWQAINYVSTEDARVDAELIKVGPEIAGKVLDVRVKEGDMVAAGETMVRLDDKNTSWQSRDSSLVSSPAAGRVIKKFVNEGELVSPGQRLFLMADLDHLYVSARIEETKINRLAVGQPVEITVDAYKGRTFTGIVEQIGLAADSTFSLLPSTNVSGNFIKVTQRVPIKIKVLNFEKLQVLPGMNAVVKIATGG